MNKEMILHWNIEQRTQDWHKVKYGYIGSSDAAKVLKYKPMEDIAFELAAMQTEPCPEFFEEGYISNDMYRGIELEPAAIAAVKQKYGIETSEIGFVHSSTLPIGVSPDNLSLCTKIAIETKCLSAKEHLKVVYSGKVPYKYTPQIIQYFAVITLLEEVYWAAYRPESPKQLAHIKITNNTLVNIGTEAKAVMVTMGEAAQILRTRAAEIQEDANIIIENLKK